MINREKHLELTQQNFIVALNMGVTEARIQNGTTLAEIAESMDWDVTKLDEALTFPSSLSLDQIGHICLALGIQTTFAFGEAKPPETAANE